MRGAPTTTTHNLGLPASECAKLVRVRPAPDQPAAHRDVVRAAAAEAAAPAPATRPRPAHHLSGFARA